MRRAALLVAVAVFLLVGILAPLAAAAGDPVEIIHTPPTSALPGQQIDLVAVLRNATSASVTWSNGSVATATVPMTNLSQAQDGGWVFEAWLPAQPEGTQVSYSITAKGPGATNTAQYTLFVAAPSSTGMTAADVNRWILTMVAVFSMAASTVVAAYYYTGLRLRRERA